jgi:hypothetical protein
MNDDDEQRLVLCMLEKFEKRAHFIGDVKQADVACSRHYYGCIMLDCRGFTPAAVKKHIDALRSAQHLDHVVHLVAIIEAVDKQLSDDYHAAGADTLLMWPINADELEQKIQDCQTNRQNL